MTQPVKKAYEITNAKISFVSLVDKAANKRPFLIVKEQGKKAFTTRGRIIKADSESHFVTGVVYEPMVEDAHGNYMTADEIQKAAYWFAKNGNKVDLQHNFVSAEGTAVVESWIAKSDTDINGETVKAGTWLMTVEIKDDDLWQSIEKGELTGLSMGGLGDFSQEDTNLSITDETVTKAQGKIQKGKMADSYKAANISSSFWNAFDSLRNCLYSYNGYTGTYTYQTDSDAIKDALADFNQIITDLLTDATSSEPLAKSLFACNPTPEKGRIEKAGRSLSAKNRETLQGVYDSLGTFLASFDADPDKDKPGGDTGTTDADGQQDDSTGSKKQKSDKKTSTEAAQDAAANKTDDPDDKSGDDTSTDKTTSSKEGKTMTKSEAEKIVQDAIAKVLGEKQQAEQTPSDTQIKKAAGEEITADFIQKAVDAAVKKALQPEEEKPLTKAEAEQFIDRLVAKAVSASVTAVRSSRGNPTNLNGTASGTVEKSAEQHYLHGIL